MYRPPKQAIGNNGAIIRCSCYVIAFSLCCTVVQIISLLRIAIAFQQRSWISRNSQHAGLHHFLKSSLDEEQPIEPWANAMIDYSGANEYFEAHYGRHPSLQLSTSSAPYFYSDKSLEPIYNARELCMESESISSEPSKATFSSNNEFTEVELSHHIKVLEKYGMTIVNSPTRVIDWKNITQIEDVYIRELEQILPTLFSSEIKLYFFWNPMLRGENHTISSPRQQTSKDTTATHKDDNLQDETISTANVASMVHIDTDVGAYESIDEFLAIVEKNQVRRHQEHEKPFDRRLYQNEINENRRRFAVVNFWRNTNPLEPVTSSPLAILSTRYQHENDVSVGANPIDGRARDKLSAFPNARPDLEHSKWYTFPNMASDEVLIFYQYDRLVTQPSDLWHCAISVKENDRARDTEAVSSRKGQKVPRESFDIRALVVFDDVVDEEKDRFQPDRVRPVLSFEESGCFCDEQAEKRSL